MAARLRVGVVGVGYLGKFHARIYAGLEGVELVGVADLAPETARAVAEECGCRVFPEAADLIGEVDAVSIVVPTVAHLAVARPFLEAGVHVLMEKPLAPDVAEGEELVRLAERAGVVFQVGHLERFNPAVMALAARVSDPRFIEAHRIGGFVERGTDVDVVTDLMIHDIDIVMSLVRSDIAQVSAVGIPVVTEHVDIANARLEFQNGAVANVTASRVSTKKQRRMRVFGGQAYYGLDFDAQRVEVVRAVPRSLSSRVPEYVSETLAVADHRPLDAELADFVRCVRTTSRPIVDGHAGLNALKVATRVKENISAVRLS